MYAIDVECIANGYGHSERFPCQISVCDENNEVVYDEFIECDNIVSFLTPFTQLDEEKYNKLKKISLKKAQEDLKILFKNKLVVGFSVDLDFERIGLDVKDFKILDLRIESRIRNFKFNNYWYTPLNKLYYMIFKTAIQTKNHDCCEDAIACMKIYHYYAENKSNFDSICRQSLSYKYNITGVSSKSLGFRYEKVCLSAYDPKNCTCNNETKKD